jgi:hypothetical protein
MQTHASRHANKICLVFNGAFTMTMFTAPVSPKAFFKTQEYLLQFEGLLTPPQRKNVVRQGFLLWHA